MMVSFVLSFFPRDVLDEILKLIESVSEDFPSYFCAEFAVPPEQDWQLKLDYGCQGLGSWSIFMTPSGAYRHAHVAQGSFYHPKDAMRHNRDISGAWTTRSNILKTGTGFDAQKQFLADIKAAIAPPVDIPSSTCRHEKTLQYASTSLDFVFGIGLCLTPSDMALHPGNIQGYNNEIQIAGSDAAIGHNPGINKVEPIASKGDRHSKRRSPH